MNAKTRIVAATGLCMASVLGAAGSASADTVTDWNVMYDQAHSVSTTNRLRKPISQKM